MSWKPWKSLEKRAAQILGWRRIVRVARHLSVPDLEPPPHLYFLKADCKKRKKFWHHSFYKEVMEKYCKSPEDIPILITQEDKGGEQVGYKLPILVTIPIEYFKTLLDSAYTDLKVDIKQTK